MSSSTTQDKAGAEATSNFQRELQKKIRNKQKKLEKIVELQTKVKKKEVVANEEQQEKLASKPALEAEIAEVKHYLELYNSTATDIAEREKKINKQHAKELHVAQKATVTAIANMICMHTMTECSQTIPEDIEEGVKHFSESLNRMLCKDKSIQWRQERDTFIQCWTKLAAQSNDTVPHTDTTFGELNSAVSEQISSGGYPETIEKKKRERKPKQPKEKPEAPEDRPESVEVVEEAKPEPVQEQAKVEEAPVAQEAVAEPEAVAEEKPKEAQENTVFDEQPQPSEPAEEVKADRPAEGHRKENEAFVKRGGNRGNRGDRPRGERGSYRGKNENGRVRGYRGRGGPNKRPHGEDDDGFTIVREANDENKFRGRGRGRGRGEFRGEYRGHRGERGEFRGRGRGERPPRKDADAIDTPATETAQPAEE